MNSHKVLVADDIQENRRVLSLFLKDLGFSVIEACRALKANPVTTTIPVIMITALSDERNHLLALEAGADDFLSKPFNVYFLKARLKSLLSLKILNDTNIRYQEELKKSNVYLLKRLIATQDITIFALAKLAECRDPETGEHLERIREYVKIIATGLKEVPGYGSSIKDGFIENLYKSTPLHDIGKVGIPDRILLKPGKLTPEEFDIMKTHTLIGAETIDSAIHESGLGKSFLEMGREIAHCHHERWDGKGYPRGLRGERIPLAARITALADVYDALISKRVYKTAFPHQKAREIIISEKGGHFDPAIIDVFPQIEERFLGIRERIVDSQIKIRTVPV